MRSSLLLTTERWRLLAHEVGWLAVLVFSEKEIQLRVEFKQAYTDILLFCLFHNFLVIKMQLWAAVLSGLTVVTLFAVHASRAAIVQGGAIAYAVFWLGYILLLAASFRSLGMEKLLGPKTIELREDALFEETTLNQACHYWPNIVRIVRRPGSITVYVSAAGAAHVIPNHAFRNRHERNTFWLALQQHWQSGRGQIAPPDVVHDFPVAITAITVINAVPPVPVPGVMPTHLRRACLLYIAARGAMAILASLYESGYFRVISPVLMLLFVMIFALFMCRVQWTRPWVLILAFVEIFMGFVFFPRPGYSKGYLELSQFFTALLIAAACVILWSLVWRKQTTSWFQRS